MYEMERTTPLLQHHIEYPHTSRTPSLITATAVMLVFGGIAAGMMQASPAIKPSQPGAIPPAAESAATSPGDGAEAAGMPPMAAMTPVDHGALDREVTAGSNMPLAAAGTRLAPTQATAAVDEVPAQDGSGVVAPAWPVATVSGVATSALPADMTGQAPILTQAELGRRAE